MINFWSMMCGYCIDELPEIAKYADTLPDNVQVITVCLDLESDEEIKAAQDTLKAAGFKGTTLIKGDGDFKTVFKEIQYAGNRRHRGTDCLTCHFQSAGYHADSKGYGQ